MNWQRLPEREVLTLAPYSLDKSIEFSKNQPSHNEQIELNEQNFLFLNNNIFMPLPS